MKRSCQSAWLEMNSAKAAPALRVAPASVVSRLTAEETSAEAFVDVLAHQGVEQLVLAGEAGVDGALGQARGRGDVVKRRALVAVLGEHLAGGLQQPLPGLCSGWTRARLGTCCQSSSKT